MIEETELPSELSAFQAVEVAYPDEIVRCHDALLRGLAVMVECDKGLTPYFYKAVRDRLRTSGLKANYLDGRAPDDGGPPQSLNGVMIGQLRQAVRGAVDRRVIVLPHLDLLTTSSGGLTSEAREVIGLMYENPNILWLGFRDPSFPVPKVLNGLFPHRISILGVPRDRLGQLVTQRESRKLGRGGLDNYKLYKSVSGVHAVRLRHVLESIDGEDYPEDASSAWSQIRDATLSGGLTIPEIDLNNDIGGYKRVKEKITRDILDVILHKESLEDIREIERIESLIPRGMLFWGPPGTGKTLFAKAIATALGAAVQVVNGPELKSRWVGESEENLRRIFIQARQSAPSLIVFDELDSFAAARGTFTGSGVEHSMVNQLLTELDGFRSNEMVFVIGTTNFVESIDPALLRPGRLELKLHIPYPDALDRRAVLDIYDRKLGLQLSEKALALAVKQSAYPTSEGTRWSGDHLQALCRRVARLRLRGNITGETDAALLEQALCDDDERTKLTPHEERVVATHEAGHAVVAMNCPHAPPIDRISIRGDLAGALGFVSYADPAHRHVTTRGQLLDSICMLFGGREAEALMCDDLSIGSAHDLSRATQIARALVEQYGMGPHDLSVADYYGADGDRHLSDDVRAEIDRGVQLILKEQRARAAKILSDERDVLTSLRDLLIERKVLDNESLAFALKSERAGDG